MLLPMKEILNRAETENYAVAAPNVFTSLEVRAALDTAQALQTPIILDIAYESVTDFRTLGVFAVQLAKEACIPVAVNLDHGHYSKEHPKEIEDAIEAGFSAVMVDASDRPYDENVAITREVAELAHKHGISVEAEIGHVGKAQEYTLKEEFLTDPDVCARFVRDTGVDCVAIAIGTAHGVYIGHKPFIDTVRLQAIHREVPVPLVLHGASGSGDENLREVCRMGIRKVNICVDLLNGAYREVLKRDLSGNNIYHFWETVSEGWKQQLAEKIRLMGSEGRARNY